MVVEIFVGESSVFVVVGAAQVIGIDPHDFFEVSGVVLIHFQCFRVECVLHNVVLNFVKDLEVLQMVECFGAASELIVDFEFATKIWQVVERLEMR